MGFYFRKRIKLFPGIHINLSKSGVSSSFGVKGARVNVGKRGTYLNSSIPGTGIYGRHKLSGKNKTNTTKGKYNPLSEASPLHRQKRYPGAALLSFFIPGFGQLVKGQLVKVLLVWFIGGFICLLSWSTIVIPLFIWLWNVYDAYRSNPKQYA